MGKDSRSVNTLGWDRCELVELDGDGSAPVQASHEGRTLQIVSAPSCGAAPVGAASAVESPVRVTKRDDTFVLENRYLRAEFLKSGQLTRLLDKECRREIIEAGAHGNQFVIFDDHPNNNDAWDIDAFHLETRAPIPGAEESRVLEEGPLRSMVEFRFGFGHSKLTERVSLAAHSKQLEFACDVDWHQRHEILKVEFPVAVKAQEAAFEIQFGYVKRPTHFNTTYDIARFESCGHRWVDLSQPDYGVALFTDSRYGYSVCGPVMRISMLRASTYPDSESDQGFHSFRFGCYPHANGLIEAEVVRRAYEFNLPLTVIHGQVQEQSWWRLDSAHVILDTVKKAEDSDAVVIRLYETHGVRGSVTLESALPFQRAWRANLLEEKQALIALEGGRVSLDFKPFQIITVILET